MVSKDSSKIFHGYQTVANVLSAFFRRARGIPLPRGWGNACDLGVARACAFGRSRIVRVCARAVWRACACVRAFAGARARARCLAGVRARALARMSSLVDIISSGQDARDAHTDARDAHSLVLAAFECCEKREFIASMFFKYCAEIADGAILHASARTRASTRAHASALASKRA